MILHGRELSWICLGSCALDLTINAIITYAVTATPSTSVLTPPAIVEVRPTGPGHSCRRARRLDLSSISIQIIEEVAFDEEIVPYVPLRLGTRSAAGGEPFLREPPPAARAEGSRPLLLSEVAPFK